MKPGVSIRDKRLDDNSIKWKIYYKDSLAGKVSIKKSDKPTLDIHVSKKYRSRGIGSKAIALALKNSDLDKVYAHIRKSNVASIKAARSAGFKESKDAKSRQIIMEWSKKMKPGKFAELTKLSESQWNKPVWDKEVTPQNALLRSSITGGALGASAGGIYHVAKAPTTGAWIDYMLGLPKNESFTKWYFKNYGKRALKGGLIGLGAGTLLGGVIAAMKANKK